jgi:hypothetical protein
MQFLVRLDLTYGDLFPLTQYVHLTPDGRSRMTVWKNEASPMPADRAELVADTMKKFFEAESRSNPNLKSYAVRIEAA